VSTVFIGGSRHISRLPSEITKRLNNVIASGHEVIVGDANGADKAVQKHLRDVNYDNVTVFCSGPNPRNNLGLWRIHPVNAPKHAKGFQFYAAKDREMARNADFGLMIWDGKSPGTVLNVLRLVRAGKISVLFNVHEKAALNIKSVEHWNEFLDHCSLDFRHELEERATSEEWVGSLTQTLPGLTLEARSSVRTSEGAVPRESLSVLNTALASGDLVGLMRALRSIVQNTDAGERTTAAVFYSDLLDGRLDSADDLNFSTALELFASVGLSLEVKAQTHIS